MTVENLFYRNTLHLVIGLRGEGGRQHLQFVSEVLVCFSTYYSEHIPGWKVQQACLNFINHRVHMNYLLVRKTPCFMSYFIKLKHNGEVLVVCPVSKCAPAFLQETTQEDYSPMRCESLPKFRWNMLLPSSEQVLFYAADGRSKFLGNMKCDVVQFCRSLMKCRRNMSSSGLVLLRTEDGGFIFLRKVGKYLPRHMASYHRRQ